MSPPDARNSLSAVSRQARRYGAVEFLLYFSIACLCTWPLLTSGINKAIPAGSEHSPTVPLFNVWTVWWNSDRLAHFFSQYWNAPIFYPEETAFARSETQPLTALVAPVLWLSGSRFAAYNTWLLASLTLNGWTAFLLFRGLQFDRFSSFMTGALTQLLPFIHWKLGILQLVPVWGIVWTLHSFIQFHEKPSCTKAAMTGLAFATTWHLCNYYGLFLSVLLLLNGFWLCRRRLFELKPSLKLSIAPVLAILLAAPTVSVQLRIAESDNWSRHHSVVSRLSASLRDYGQTASDAAGDRFVDAAGDELKKEALEGARRPLGVGLLLYSAALAGTWRGLRTGPRHWTIFCVSLAATASALSFGPDFTVCGWSPYRTLMNGYPGFAWIRSPYRFAVFTQLAVVFLSAAAFHDLGQFLRARIQFRSARFGIRLLSGLVIVSSIWPAPTRLLEVPGCREDQRWIDWLRNNTEQDAAIVCVPFVRGRSTSAFADTAESMYWATWHLHPMASGYTGYFPRSFFALQRAMKDFPSATSIQRLTAIGVEYCIVRPEHALADAHDCPPELKLEFSDPVSGSVIYRIRTMPNRPATQR